MVAFLLIFVGLALQTPAGVSAEETRGSFLKKVCKNCDACSVSIEHGKIANFEDYDAPKNSSHTARNEIKCSGEIEILETRICSS